MSFPLDDAPFFGFLVVLEGTDGRVVGLVDDDHEAALDDVVGMLDFFFVGEFLFERFG